MEAKSHDGGLPTQMVVEDDDHNDAGVPIEETGSAVSHKEVCMPMTDKLKMDPQICQLKVDDTHITLFDESTQILIENEEGAAQVLLGSAN
ncbi:hypothetical protein Nepgr_020254 [Nepenthes gracilis]|uniref:Uncharacterized protein n=1 Tax=Nepenthes gracilis TaxID=150966 RepID=A0AAD3SVQ4_NEPGR|nr:hypothetical protein Nepgr_020254 [Nepenthes gracilis]